MPDTQKKTMTPIVCLRNFFGQKPGQTMSEFLAEVKELSDEDRINLAKLAATELGVDLVEQK